MCWWHLVLVVGCFLTQGTQAYAPITWTQTPASGRTLMPKGFKGWSSVNTVAPQELVIGSPGKTSPSSVPYFTARSDNSITWDDMGWCVEASGRASGDTVRVNQCNGDAAQKWNWIPDGHGRNMIQLKGTNKCLDVEKGGLQEASIELRDCASHLTDAWKFEEPSPFPMLAPAGTSSIRQALVSLLLIVGVGMLGLGAWMWRPQNKAREVATRQGGMFADGDVEASIHPMANATRTGNVSMMAGSGADVQADLKAKTIDEAIVYSRRDVMTQVAAGLLTLPLAAQAEVRGPNATTPKSEDDINKFLKSQGFPSLKVGDGLTPFVGYVGVAPPANLDGIKAKDRGFSGTLLVRFVHPFGWLREVPNITENGEAGNLGANDYQKGDNATFAAIALPKDAKLDTISKPFFKKFMVSQMTGDSFDDVKVKKVNLVKQDDGTEMAIVDFTYTLLTRAGFTVDRRGIAGCMVVSGAVVGLVTATTEARFSQLESKLRESANSFRAYAVKKPADTGNYVVYKEDDDL